MHSPPMDTHVQRQEQCETCDSLDRGPPVTAGAGADGDKPSANRQARGSRRGSLASSCHEEEPQDEDSGEQGSSLSRCLAPCRTGL